MLKVWGSLEEERGKSRKNTIKKENDKQETIELFNYTSEMENDIRNKDRKIYNEYGKNTCSTPLWYTSSYIFSSSYFKSVPPPKAPSSPWMAHSINLNYSPTTKMWDHQGPNDSAFYHSNDNSISIPKNLFFPSLKSPKRRFHISMLRLKNSICTLHLISKLWFICFPFKLLFSTESFLSAQIYA